MREVFVSKSSDGRYEIGYVEDECGFKRFNTPNEVKEYCKQKKLKVTETSDVYSCILPEWNTKAAVAADQRRANRQAEDEIRRQTMEMNGDSFDDM